MPRSLPAILAIALLCLSACATAPRYSAPAGTITTGPAGGTTIRTPCPHLAETYSAADQARAADELAALPPDSVVARMAIEDVTLRDQIRACRGEGA